MNKLNKYRKRKIRVRSRIKGEKDRPRLSVFRSNKNIAGQIIDDTKQETLVYVSSVAKKSKSSKKSTKSKRTTKVETAGMLGEELAKKALKRKIKKIVFDRGGYKYHGRVKSFAEGARKGGLKF